MTSQTCTAPWKRNLFLEKGSTPTLITRRAPRTTSWASTPRPSPHCSWPPGSPGGRRTYSSSRPRTPSSARSRSTTARTSATSRGTCRTKRIVRRSSARRSQPDRGAHGERGGRRGGRGGHLGGSDGAARHLPRRIDVPELGVRDQRLFRRVARGRSGLGASGKPGPVGGGLHRAGEVLEGGRHRDGLSPAP